MAGKERNLKGFRKCRHCKFPFPTGSSPSTVSCTYCYNNNYKKSPIGLRRCPVCNVQFKKQGNKTYCGKSCQALSMIDRNKRQKAIRDTLPGRLRLCLNKAKNRRKCTISIDWLLEQWTKQGGRCYYTGWDMELNGKKANRPTLERIDSTKDYIESNVVICCKQVNWAKNDYTLDEFINMCRAVINEMDNK